jgi:hypothetical protein
MVKWYVKGGGIEKMDLAGFFLAAKAYWVNHLDPYVESNILKVAAADPTLQNGYEYLPFLYHPLGLALFWPLTFLDTMEAKLAMKLVNGLFFILAAILLERLFTAYIKGWGWRILAVFVCMFLHHQVVVVREGQINNILLVFIMASLLSMQRRGSLPAWLWFGNFLFISIKIPWLITLIPFAVHRRNWKPMLQGMGGAAAVVALLWVAQPDAFRYYLGAVTGSTNGVKLAANPKILEAMEGGGNLSLSKVARKLALAFEYTGAGSYNGMLLSLISAALLIFLGWHLWRQRAAIRQGYWRVETGMGTLALLMLSMGIVSWQHYISFVFPLLFLACLAAGSRPLAQVLAAGAGIWVYLYGLKIFNPELPVGQSDSAVYLWALQSSIPPIIVFGLAVLCLQLDVDYNRNRIPEKPAEPVQE